MATQTLPNHKVEDPTRERERTVQKARTGGKKPLRFLKQLGTEAMNDGILDLAAMMAYYAVLALFPMVVFTVTIALLVIDPSTIHEGVEIATRAMPAGVTELLIGQINSLINTAGAGFAIIGAALALWGASRGANSMGAALNVIFNKKESRSWIKRQAIAIGVTLGVAIMMVIALGLLVVGPAAGGWVADKFGLGGVFDVAWGIGRWLGAGLLVMVVWALLYKFLPDTDAPLRIFTPGAFVGVVLWLAISLGFGFYLDNFNSYNETYGALGGAIIFLTWLWLSNLAILMGAEINDVLADFRKHEDPAAAALAHEEEKTVTVTQAT